MHDQFIKCVEGRVGIDWSLEALFFTNYYTSKEILKYVDVS